MLCTLRRTLALGGLFGALVSSIQGQVADPTFPVNGTQDKGLVATLLEHATIHVDAGTTMENATLVMHNGRIVAVGPDGETSHAGPAVRVDMTGLYLYPSFVDLNSDFGTPEVQDAGWSRTPQDLSDKKGAYGWNEAVRPETSAAAAFDPDAETAERLRKSGVGAVLTHVNDGVVRGTGAVVLPLEDAREALLKPKATFHMSFRKGSSSQNYPSSLMGATALLRQTHLDAAWYEEASAKGQAGSQPVSRGVCRSPKPAEGVSSGTLEGRLAGGCGARRIWRQPTHCGGQRPRLPTRSGVERSRRSHGHSGQVSRGLRRIRPVPCPSCGA